MALGPNEPSIITTLMMHSMIKTTHMIEKATKVNLALARYLLARSTLYLDTSEFDSCWC